MILLEALAYMIATSAGAVGIALLLRGVQY